MRRTTSLQRRLSIGLAVGVTATWLLATLAGGMIIRHELNEAFDSALQETAQRILPLAATEILDRSTLASLRRSATIGEHKEFLTYLVRDRDGKLLLRSHDADQSVFPPTPTIGFHDGSTHRLYGEAAISGSMFIEIAEPLAHRHRAAFEAMAGLFLPLLLLIPLSVLGVWWFVRRNLRSVIAFAAEIETRGQNDLSPASFETRPDEIRPIIDAVNKLMGRLRRALDAERSFTQNSAHELRTPVAASLALTQRLIAETGNGPLCERARQIEASLRQLANISEKLMQLAQAEGGRLLAETPQDLAPVLMHVIDEFGSRQAIGSRSKLKLHEPRELCSPMDADAFAILMRNLIENAVKHGKSGDDVHVYAAEDGVIKVVNAGPVVPADVLVRLKRRFERGDATTKGSGLGLAIADAIATGAGGRLEVRSPASDRSDGFEAVLYLPRATPDMPKQKEAR